MARYIAFLRGVSPVNAQMKELKRCFESAGFSDVKTVLSSGNVAFSSRASSEVALQRRAEVSMQNELGRVFLTIVRQASDLQKLVDSDPFALFDATPAAKRVVTFLQSKSDGFAVKLPLVLAGGTIFAADGREVLSVYVPGPSSSQFARVIETTFGKSITTRTLQTVRKCACA